MKKLFSFALLLVTALSASAQRFVDRSSQSNTVQDARLAAKFNFVLPRFDDTTQANLSVGTDSCGAQFFQRTTNQIWKRSCNPKRWELIIQDIYISKSKAQIDALVSAGKLVKGATYKITGVHPTLYDDGTSSGTTIIVQASDSNKISPTGTGVFYNPKYSTNPVWNPYSTATSSVPTATLRAGEVLTANNGATATALTGFSTNKINFTVTSGDWTTATSYTAGTSGATATISAVAVKTFTVGQKVSYGGYTWSNVNGNVGAATSVLALNSEWVKVAYSSTDYNIVYDPIVYDYANNLIIKRSDALNNTVQYSSPDLTFFATKSLIGTPISVFGWGNTLNVGNIVNGAYLECVNTIGSVLRNQVYEQGMIAGNIVGSATFLQDNVVLYRGEIRNNLIYDGVFFYDNTVSNLSTINTNKFWGALQINSNTVNFSSAINTNEGRASYIYDNQLRSSSTITGNLLVSQCFIYKNNLVSSSINSNTLNGLYVQAVGSDQAYIHNNIMNYGQINSNILNVGFNGRRVYIGNNYLFGDIQQDAPLIYAAISSNTIASLVGNGNAYIRSSTLRIGQIVNANIQGGSNSFVNLTVEDYIWDFQNQIATYGLRGVNANRNKIEATFTITFSGAVGLGAIGTVNMPPLQAPAGYFISEVTVDAGTGLTGSGAVINLGIASDGTQSGLNDTQGAVASINSTPVQKIIPSTFTKATALRAIVMEVKTAAITSGTLGITIKLQKLL